MIQTIPPIEALYYNALASHTVGDREKLAKLHASFGTWRAAYDAKLALRGAGYGWAQSSPEKQWDSLAAHGVRLVMRGDAEYPALFNELADAPFGIYVRGANLADDAGPAVGGAAESAFRFAVVGTRRATPEGKDIARRFARELAANGIPIVSGLAFGIDAAGHEGCLDADRPTVAVLAGGLDSVYPRSNEKLAARILAGGGTIISEYPLGAPPFANRFLERNRLISGLSRGVLVVEAPADSGSLATARLALEQNRDVFVVPGPITHPNFFGSHALIRQGAELVSTPEHILASYGIGRAEKITRAIREAGAEETLVLKALAGASKPLDVDKIITMTRLEPRIVNQTLSFLLARNVIKEEQGGYTIM